MNIKVKRITHKGYSEFLKFKIRSKLGKVPKGKEYDLKQMFGRYQYLHIYAGGSTISLVNLASMEKGFDISQGSFWEIYQVEGPKLFTDVERFPTKELAEEAIKKLFKKSSFFWKMKNGYYAHFKRHEKIFEGKTKLKGGKTNGTIR